MRTRLVEIVKKRKGVLYLGAYLTLTGISNTFGSEAASVLWDVVFYSLETVIVIFGMFAYIKSKRQKLDKFMGFGVVAYKAILITSIYYGAIMSGGEHEVFISYILSNTSAMVATPAITLILYYVSRKAPKL